MNRTRILKYSILTLLILAGSLLSFLFYKIHRIEKDLENLRISNFHIHADNPKLSLIKGELLSDKILIRGLLEKDSLYISTSSLIIEGLDILPFLVNKEILVNKIKIDSPTITVQALNSNSTKKRFVKQQKIKEVHIKHLELSQGKFFRTSLNKDTILTAKYQILLSNTSFNPSIQSFPIPKEYKIEMEHIEFEPDPLNKIRIPSIQMDTLKWSLSAFHLIPKFNKTQYSRQLTNQKDRIELKTDTIVIHHPEFAKEPNSIWKSSFVEINQLHTDIYRDKTLPPDLSYRPMISKMLRTLPITLDIDSLQVKKGSITYGELLKHKDKAGEIAITNLDLNISRLNNTFKDTMNIEFTGSFMDQGQLYIHSKIPVWNTNDYFITNIYLNDFDTKRLDAFTSKNLQVRNTGFLQHAVFQISGNENNATGTVVMSYKDLQIRVMNKEGSKEKKLWSTIANTLIRKENKNLKQQAFEVTRNKTKSYFNYMWLCVQKGLITSMIY
ncbi:hypothetical protein D3A96_01590 [Robertkochia marina]|nr:hypothetical protein D3A96_01590 [Robertkochia marina]